MRALFSFPSLSHLIFIHAYMFIRIYLQSSQSKWTKQTSIYSWSSTKRLTTTFKSIRSCTVHVHVHEHNVYSENTAIGTNYEKLLRICDNKFISIQDVLFAEVGANSFEINKLNRLKYEIWWIFSCCMCCTSIWSFSGKSSLMHWGSASVLGQQTKKIIWLCVGAHHELVLLSS